MTPSPKFGINDHFLLWTDPADYPIADLTTLGVKVCRNDLIADPGSNGYPGVFGSAQCVSAVSGWAGQLRSAWIDPFIVVTFGSLIDTATIVAGIVAIVTAVPGLIIEWGNELDYSAPSITAPEYVAQFGAVVAAVHAADPTAKIGPAPVANINPDGDGWNATEAMFAAGLGAIPYDFLPFHDYPWPDTTSPTTPWAGSGSAETLTPTYTDQCTQWGNKAPYWLTEWGWQNVDGSMTDALQATYCEAFWASPQVQALPVVVAYELGDGGGDTYGWMTAHWAAPKPVYTAMAALLAPPARAVDYQADATECRAQLALAVSRLQSARVALNGASKTPGMTTPVHQALATVDGILRHEEIDVLEPFLKAAPPTA